MSPFAGFDPKRPRLALPPELVDLVTTSGSVAEAGALLGACARLAQDERQPPVLTLEDLEVLGRAARSVPRELVHRLTERGVLVGATVATRSGPVDLWTWNLPDAVAALRRREREGWPTFPEDAPDLVARANAFDVYESNIGVLTAAVADRLKDAMQTYPEGWVEAAIEEAAVQNKRSWAYVEAILRRWHQEGNPHGEPARDSEPNRDAAETFGGRFKHLFRQP